MSAPASISAESGSGPVLTAMVNAPAATPAITPKGAFSITIVSLGQTLHFFMPAKYGSGRGFPFFTS